MNSSFPQTLHATSIYAPRNPAVAFTVYGFPVYIHKSAYLQDPLKPATHNGICSPLRNFPHPCADLHPAIVILPRIKTQLIHRRKEVRSREIRSRLRRLLDGAVHNDRVDTDLGGHVLERRIGGDDGIEAGIDRTGIVESGVDVWSEYLAEEGVVVSVDRLGEEGKAVADLEFLAWRFAGGVDKAESGCGEKREHGCESREAHRECFLWVVGSRRLMKQRSWNALSFI